MSDPDLSGRVVAITGASSGIGEATALACAQAGAAVALGARRADRITALARRIESEGGRALALTTDVADADSASAFVRTAHQELGRLDALVNNAGLMLLGPIESADLDDWRRMVDVNVLGLLYCTHAAVPLMREQGGGHIVNVSSVAGRFANAGSGVYNLTKFGINAFSEALRQEVSSAGIRVTVIEPGVVATELLSHNSPQVQEVAAQRIGDVEVLEAQDIADAIVFALAAPDRVAINELLVRPTGQRR